MVSASTVLFMCSVIIFGYYMASKIRSHFGLPDKEKRIQKTSYASALSSILPYCKEELLKNEIPYVISKLRIKYIRDECVENEMLSIKIRQQYNSANIKFSMDPPTEYIEILCSGEDHYKVKFLYYLIAGVIEVDRRLELSYTYPMKELSTDMIDASLMELMVHEPEVYSQLPLYVLALHDTIHKYKSGELTKLRGQDFSNLWYGIHVKGSDDDMEASVRYRL